MRKRAAFIIVSLLTFCILLTACTKEITEEEKDIDESRLVIETSENATVSTTPTTLPTPTPDVEQIPEGMVKSYLTGEYISPEQGRRRPVAVMLNNIIDAVPQAGISQAGVIYEATVEGGITRLMGIFENYDNLEKIGSVRSCREYYLFFATEFDALYCHYGQAAYALPYLELDFIDNISGLSAEGDTVFYRSSDRPSPHNAYTSYDGIQRGVKMLNYRQTYKDDYQGHYQFVKVGEENDIHGSPANVVRFNGFETNLPWFEYDGATGLYRRFQYHDAQIDQNTGEQLTCKNILVEYLPYVPYEDGSYLNVTAYAPCRGKYFTNGQVIDINCVKNEDDVWGVTHYYRADNGEELKLNTGQTWVEIVFPENEDDIVIE